MNYKEKIINLLERLTNDFGYTKKEISKRIGVHQSKLNYVYQAKRVDRNLFTLLHVHFTELQIGKINNTITTDHTSIRHDQKLEAGLISEVNVIPKLDNNTGIALTRLREEIESLKMRIEQLEDKNK